MDSTLPWEINFKCGYRQIVWINISAFIFSTMDPMDMVKSYTYCFFMERGMLPGYNCLGLLKLNQFDGRRGLCCGMVLEMTYLG